MGENSSDKSPAQLEYSEFLKKLEHIKSVRDYESIQNVCRANIISFDQTNLANFLESVHVTIIKFEKPKNKKIVLDFAKSQMNNELISNKNYETFKAFRDDVIEEFHDPGTFVKIRREITSLSQSSDEDIFHFGRRAMQLKDSYEEELRLFYEARNVPKDLLEKNEATAIEYFYKGLLTKVESSVTTNTNSLKSAIEIAASGNSASSSRVQQKSVVIPGDNEDLLKRSSLIEELFSKVIIKKTSDNTSSSQAEVSDDFGQSSQPKDFDVEEADEPKNKIFSSISGAFLKAKKALIKKNKQ